MPLIPGTRIGPCEVVALLGAGGMGEVYRARDTRLNRDVAIKVLPASFAGDADRLARFEREAQVLAALNHPNIAHIHGLEEANGASALVMELVEGEDLSQRLARGPMPIDEALLLARQIAEALEAAHEQGIVHRDLKPANIKVRADGTVKVLDFGLAKAIDPAAASSAETANSPTLSVRGTQMGLIIGTAAYMAPEQARGRVVDRRADIWAFGAVLYEMLTGRRAFPGEEISDILASVIKDDVDWLALPADVPEPIRRLLRRCLEKDPKRRLRDIGEARLMLADPAAFTMGGPAAADTNTSAPRILPRWRRALPVAAGIIAGALVAVYAVRTLTPAAPAAVTRFSMTLPEDQNFTNTGRHIVALSPDGSQLVYVANGRLFLRPLAALDARAIPGSESPAGVNNPVFSPDGQSLAFYSTADRALRRLPISGGAAVTICAADSPYGLSWDETGIIFGQAGKGILRVSPEGGEPAVIVAVPPDESASLPQLLPGQRVVLFSVKKASDPWTRGQVVVQPIDGGPRRTLVDGAANGRYLPTGHLVYAVSGTLLAIPFDPRSLTTSGGPVPVIAGVRRALSTLVTSTGAAQFSVAENGSVAYVPGPVNDDGVSTALAIFNRQGVVRHLGLPLRPYRSPRVSPDGRTVAVDSEDDTEAVIWIYDLAGTSAMRRLTFGGKNRAPVWSPDGQWIAFQSDRDGDRAIFRQRADGSDTPERLTTPDPGVTHIPQSWSPDGRHLLFGATQPNRLQASTGADGQPETLWTLDLTTRKTTPFGDVQSLANAEGAFSPDGRWIVYFATSAGGGQSFVQPFPATGARFEVPLGQGGGAPYWSRSGHELVFSAGPQLSAVVPFTDAPRVSFGPAVEFRRGHVEGSSDITRRSSDPLPDGESYVGVLPGGASADPDDRSRRQMVVVLDWFDEVRQRVPRP